MKKILLLLLVVCFGTITYFAYDKIYRKPNLKAYRLGSTSIQVEIASTDQDRQRGLSGRSNLPKNQGMLFIFPYKSFPEFWMKDLKFPIDFLWIDGNRVVEITPNVLPPKSPEDNLSIYRPSKPVDKVLELNADFTFYYQVKVGDLIEEII